MCWGKDCGAAIVDAPGLERDLHVGDLRALNALLHSSGIDTRLPL